MNRFLKIFGILAISLSSIGQASALSFTATTTSELFSFTYTASSPFTLSNLTLTSPTNVNLLAGTGLGIYSGSAGSLITNLSNTISAVVSTVPGTTYTSFPSVSATLISGSFSFTSAAALSPVPLPASFPLFAMALVVLGMIGYRSIRAGGVSSNKNDSLSATA